MVPKIASIAILSVKKYLISNSGTVSSSTFASPPIEVTDFSSGSKFKTLRPTNHFPALLKAEASWEFTFSGLMDINKTNIRDDTSDRVFLKNCF